MNAVACRHSPTAKATAAASRQAKPPSTASRHATTQRPAASDSAPTRLRPSATLTIGSCASTTVTALARISRPITLGAIPELARVRRHDPRQHAPADRDQGDVDQREAPQRAVAQQEPVAARHRLRASLVAHGRDEDREVDEVRQRVGQEEHDEAVEAKARDHAPDRGAEAEPGS